jgi:TonB-dependent receptor
MRTKSALLGSSILVGVASLLLTATPAIAQATDQGVETVVVTGYRASLQDETNFKRNSIGFNDSVFAEDIGKFPDTDVAEALNRIPGVTINRDVNGEGMDVQIRGLGTNFTRLTLNNAAIAVASTGPLDATNNNREVDLNMFPGELFTQLSVYKTPQAEQLEGGAGGIVNMRTLRPFDHPGLQFSYNLQGTNESTDGAIGKRGTLIASDTEGPFGLLIGISGTQNPVFVKGWEDGNAGWVGPSEQANQCTASSGCAVFGTKSWPIQASVPVSSTPGVPALLVPIPSSYTLTAPATPYVSGGTNYFPAGYTINQAVLTALNPALTATQISNALLPRLGRAMFYEGTRDKYNAVLSAEYRPTDDLHFYLDAIFGREFNAFNRSDIDWGVRSGAGSQTMIPANLTLSPQWLAGTNNAGGAVTSGTFYGAGFFLEARPYTEKGDFFSINPGMSWDVTDLLHIDAQVNASRSHFLRDSPSILVTTCWNTPLASTMSGNCTAPTGGAVVTFSNLPGQPFPTETSSLNLNSPNSYIWGNGRVNLQDEKRYVLTNGAHINLKYGGDEFSVKVGGSYDEIYRFMTGIDDSTQWQNAVCGDDPNVFLPGPNSGMPGCSGVASGAPPGYTQPAYKGYGTGYSTGFPALAYQGSLVPTSAIPQYLVPGPTGFVTVNYPAFEAATNYKALDAAAIAAVCNNVHCKSDVYPFSTTTASSDVSGAFDEKDWGLYAQADGVLHLGDRELKYDFGLRWSETHQSIYSPTQFTDPRNATLSDGGLYPNYYTFNDAKHTYQAFLPSATIVYEVTDDFQVRASISRTMNRPNISQMISVVNFSDLTAQSASLGNPGLKPYFSNNIDLGAEYYTGGEGYFGVAIFRKDISGFTTSSNVTEPFSYLNQFGINWAALNITQQDALCGRTPGCVVATATDATVGNTTITVTETVNAAGLEIINGMEFDYVQPLDFLLDQYGLHGFGVTANMTIIDQKSTGVVPTYALGVAPFAYNATGYYEDNGISVRLSYVWNDKTYASSSNQQSLCLPAGSSSGGCPGGAYLFGAAYGQADFSAGLKLARLFGDIPSDPEVTFAIQNLFDAKQESFDQYQSSVHSYYIKGQTYLFGLRGTF